MTRTDIINAIARTIGARTYCEIGVRNPGDNFDKIQVAHKVGVDPAPARADILRMTSDQYFAGSPAPVDLYFIDGLHTKEQAFADFRHADQFLNPRGVIVMHDCLPRSLSAMAPVKPPGGGPWNGTVWQAWKEIRHCPGWESYCIDRDHGCGVAWKGTNTSPHDMGKISAADYLANAPALSRSAPLAFVLFTMESRP